MTLIQDQLRELLGKELALVCTDGVAFRGRLEKYDAEAMVLQEVLELSKSDMRWKEPTVSPRSHENISSHIDAYGVVDTQRLRVALRTVVIRLGTVSRIWPWAPSDSTTAGYERFTQG